LQRLPSLTAKGVALLRAAHQLLEGGSIFPDPYAIAILGESEDAILGQARQHPENDRLRLFVVARSRFAEEKLANAVDRGVRQAVVLGAGLDTFGLRNPHAEKGLRVFEVDRPPAPQWKLEHIGRANLCIPESLSFVAVDFERQKLITELAAVGFNPRSPAFFTWLGVVPYLSRDAVLATLSAIASVPGAEVVLDYGQPPEAYPQERRASYAAMIARAATLGEPWLTFFRPAELRNELVQLGFTEIQDLGPADVAKRHGVELDLDAPGAHVVHAQCAAA
jgi:methyltransferase (TIGR00027 family)